MYLLCILIIGLSLRLCLSLLSWPTQAQINLSISYLLSGISFLVITLVHCLGKALPVLSNACRNNFYHLQQFVFCSPIATHLLIELVCFPFPASASGSGRPFSLTLISKPFLGEIFFSNGHSFSFSLLSCTLKILVPGKILPLSSLPWPLANHVVTRLASLCQLVPPRPLGPVSLFSHPWEWSPQSRPPSFGRHVVSKLSHHTAQTGKH